MYLRQHSVPLSIGVLFLVCYAILNYSAGGASVIGCAFETSSPAIDEPLIASANDCALNLGTHARSLGICSLLLNGTATDVCKFGYAFQHDEPAVCSSAPSMQLSCYEDLAIRDDDISLCRNLQDSAQQVCDNQVVYARSHPEVRSTLLAARGETRFRV